MRQFENIFRKFILSASSLFISVHRIIERFEMDATLKIINFQPSAKDRNTFHSTRWLKVPSSLAFQDCSPDSFFRVVRFLFTLLSVLRIFNSTVSWSMHSQPTCSFTFLCWLCMAWFLVAGAAQRWPLWEAARSFYHGWQSQSLMTEDGHAAGQSQAN